jgi:hypothetical protein
MLFEYKNDMNWITYSIVPSMIIFEVHSIIYTQKMKS